MLQPNSAIFTKKYIVGDVGDDLLGKSSLTLVLFGLMLIYLLYNNLYYHWYLGPKGELQLFLDGLVEAANVPSYVKDNPFGQSAITSSHSDWAYYSKIIRKLGRELHRRSKVELLE